MAEIIYPQFSNQRGVGFWLRWGSLVSSRRKLRMDLSNEWRYTFGEPDPPDRSVSMGALLPPGRAPESGIRFIILGDTGEGDRSQYGLLPLIRGLNPDFLIINGDVAYPAGRVNERKPLDDDYLCGFFEPYRNLNCPIWAVPGNHEYYSEHQGREFHEIFCTRKYAGRWSGHGLRLVLQPGTYWELKGPHPTDDLVVIGLDSGKKANLDGKRSWFQFWKRDVGPDFKQHAWLRDRLERAELARHRVIVLFHIPALVRGNHDKSTHLEELHRIIAEFSCVRLVLCAHEHNYQQYSPQTFRQYVTDKHKWPGKSDPVQHYVVAGRSGAYLTSTAFKNPRYNCEPYPNPQQYGAQAGWGRRIVDSLGMSKAILARIVGLFSHDALSDADFAKYLSFLLVEAERKDAAGITSIRVTPVFMDDIDLLFNNLPAGKTVNVQTDFPTPVKVTSCLQDRLALNL